MINIDIRCLLASLYDQLRPARTDHTLSVSGEIQKVCPGIVFNVLLDFADYNERKGGGYREVVSRSLEVLMFGNTSVFWKDSKQPWSEAINTSNHDSCWRSDGLNFFVDLFYDCCAATTPDLRKDEEPTPINDISCNARFNHPVFSHVNVTWGYDANNRYKRQVIKVSPQ